MCALLQRRQPAPCDCCDGSGQKDCTWCRGTGAALLEKPAIFSVCTSPHSLPAVGAMMVGEELFCSLAHGCKQCPICNSKVRSDLLGFCSHLSIWRHALYLLLVLLVLCLLQLLPYGSLENSSCADMPLCAFTAGNNCHRKALHYNIADCTTSH